MALSLDDKFSLLEVADRIVVDTEGYRQLKGIAFCASGWPEGFYLPYNHDDTTNLTKVEKDKLQTILCDDKQWIMHNASFDLRFIRKHWFDYRGEFYDTMLMAHWVNEERFSYALDDLVKIYKIPAKGVMKFKELESWDTIDFETMYRYSSNDAYIEWLLFEKLYPDFEAQGFEGELWSNEQKFIRDCMVPMMERGIQIDLNFCIQEWARGTAVAEKCKSELGMNPGSSKDMKKLIIDELKLPVVKHTKSCKRCAAGEFPESHDGPPSFDKFAMAEYEPMFERLNDERARLILTYRGWTKTTGSNYRPYIDLADENFVLRPSYKLHGTRTGRLSCEKPNLQQIPKTSDKDWNGGLKRSFIPRPGYRLFQIDYSQLQFRMTAAYAKQQTLIAIFNDPDADIFTAMAEDMGWKRQNVKTLVYLILFGGGAKRARDAFGLSTIDEGKTLVDEFHAMYPGIREISNDCAKVARKQGYVAYWTGRRRHFFRNGAPYYRAFNAVIQGGEAEIMKRAMLALVDVLDEEECRMILQIHDAIIFEVREDLVDKWMPVAQQVMMDAGKAFCEFVGVDIRFSAEVEEWAA